MPMTKTLVQAGAQSATWLITQINENFLNFGPSDWQQLPQGKLRDLLIAKYPATESFTVNSPFFEALAAAGLSANTVGTNSNLEGGAYSEQCDVNFSIGYGLPGQLVDTNMTVLLKPSAMDPNISSVIVTVAVAYSVEE